MKNTWLKHATTCLLLMVLFFSTSVSAHQTGNSYLYVTEVNGQLRIDIDFIVRDLDNLLQNTAQASKDKPTSTPAPEQLQAKQAAITRIIQASLVGVMVFSTKTTSWVEPFSSCSWDKKKFHRSLIPARRPSGLPWVNPSAGPPWVYSPKRVPCIFGVALTICCFFSPCFCRV